MEKSELQTLSAVLLICLLLVLLAFGGCHDTEVTNREAIKAGLVQKPNIGTSGTHWVKP